jgi:Tol biopolymer transport system component
MKIAATALAVPACALSLLAQSRESRFTELGPAPPIDVNQMAVSPSGRLIMLGDGRSLYVFDRLTRATTQVATGQFGDITWSPRGDRLAFIRDAEKPGDTYIWTVPVDPNTGKLTGAARRVSDRAGDEPAFSHDGRQIAFAMDTDREPDGQDLGIVATAGGPARSLYQSPGGIWSISWTPDGKSIFFETDLKGGHSLLRIGAAGGTADVVQVDGESWPGVDPNGKWFLQTTDDDLYRMVGTDGRPLGRSIRVHDAVHRTRWNPDGRSMIALKIVRPSKLVLLPLGGGTNTPLSTGAVTDDWPSWSPNGDRIAVVRTDGDRRWLVVLTSNGSVQAEYKNAPEPSEYAGAVWSKDGQRLVYASRSHTSLTAVELGSGVARDIATRQAGITSYHWLDSATVRYFSWTVGAPEQHGIVRDASMSGAPRLVRDLGPTNLVHGGVVRGNDVVQGVAVGKPQFVDLSAGSVRSLGSGGGWEPDLSPDGKFAATPARGQPNAVRIYDIERGAERTVSVPFSVLPQTRVRWHPDGRHVIVAGISPGTPNTRLFLVPVNGTAVVTLSTLPRRQEIVAYAVTGDGKSLVYAEHGPHAGTIGQLSFDDILPRSPSAERKP